MEKKYTFANFFRIFEANVRLGKNTLRIRKCLHSDNHINKHGLVPTFLPYKNYYIYVKKISPAKFLRFSQI